MRRILFFTILGLVMLGSCTKFDDQLYDSINEDQYPENELQLAIIPSPAYEPMREFIDWGGWWFAQELTSDEMVCPIRHTDWDDGGKWAVLHSHQWTNSNESINNMWSRFLNGVRNSNKAIETLEQYLPSESAAIGISKLKILRGYYYYLLIDNYGKAPYVTKFKDAEDKPSNSSRTAIFDSITTEISKELQKIPEDQVSKYSVTRGMAYSLLAKLYLNAEVYTGTPQWDIAEKYCDSVIMLGYSLEGDALAPFVTQNEGSQENIWTIPFDEERFAGFNLHMRTLHYNHNLSFGMTVGPWNGFAVIEAHFNTYADNDSRKRGFLYGPQYDMAGKPIIDAAAGNKPLVLTPNIPALIMGAEYTPEQIRMSGVRVAKFEIKKGAKENLSNDFPIFRYADILLMKAESRIRQGLNGDQWVNEVRQRAGLNPWSNTTLDQLLEERGREMFWEAHRRQDLIRFGKFNDAWWEKAQSTPDRKVFPIPQWAIDENPNLAK